MTKQQKISDFTAGKAIEALEAKLPELNQRLRGVESRASGAASREGSRNDGAGNGIKTRDTRN